MIEILRDTDLPPGFQYPHGYTRILQLNLVELEPWYFLGRKDALAAMEGLQKRYPDRQLIPFARRQDNDDIACWCVGQGESVFSIHDFASSGWETRGKFENFWDWFRSAIEEMILFD